MTARSFPASSRSARALWRHAERDRDRYADALRRVRADLDAVAAGAELDVVRLIDIIDRALEPAPAETSADAERRQMACPMTHLPEMACGACGKPVETGERRG